MLVPDNADPLVINNRYGLRRCIVCGAEHNGVYHFGCRCEHKRVSFDNDYRRGLIVWCDDCATEMPQNEIELNAMFRIVARGIDAR
jgi:hypothetical protein